MAGTGPQTTDVQRTNHYTTAPPQFILLHHLFGGNDTSGRFIQSSFWRNVRMTQAAQVYNEDNKL